MRVLGIDPGTVRMGYGLLEETDHVRAVDWGVLTIRSSLPIEERLYQLYAQLLDLIIRCRPDSLAVGGAIRWQG